MQFLTDAWLTVAAQRGEQAHKLNPTPHQPRDDGWGDVVRDRESLKLISQTQVDEMDLRDFLRVQKITKQEFDRLPSWDKCEILRQASEWLTEQSEDQGEEE